MKRVCHLTTVHQPFDIRIFKKECKSLADAGFETLLIAVHNANEVVEGVKVLALEKPRTRQERWKVTTENCFKKAAELKADIYHFHDPELIPIGLRLKQRGFKVIYDVHESHAESILDRDYLHPLVRRPMSWNLARLEKEADRRLDAIVAATPKIAKSFRNKNTVLIQNYPLVGELALSGSRPLVEREAAVCYVGGVSVVRGAMSMVEGVTKVAGVRLKVAGDFPDNLRADIQRLTLSNWHLVELLGWMDREEVAKMMETCVAGMLLYLPLRNHTESQPNKLFEYMSAGLPVVASDFPHWRTIVEAEQCGILVNPVNPQEIGAAVKKLVDDRHLAQAMGDRGKKAVQEKYNWGTQEPLLIDLYRKLLG